MPALPSVLIRISTGQILQRALYPRDDMGPIVGLDPDLEWCVARTPFPAPEFDPRYYSLVQTEQRSAPPDSEFAHLHGWVRTFTTQKRATPEILTSVENKEREQLNVHVREVEALKLCILGMAVLFQEVQGLTLNGRQTAIKNRVLQAAVKVWQNHDRAGEITTQVNANQEPDLEAGWASE
jgi:hypothetical protein